jgi:hypothetical protein
MTILGMLFSGLLSALLWFEVASACLPFLSGNGRTGRLIDGKSLTGDEKTVIVLAALVQTILLVACITG